jgi:type I restriction enzyme S subunit
MSFPRYAAYKPSGVEWLGEVPEHWEVKRMASLYSEVVEAGNEDLPVLSVSIHHGVSDSELSEEEMDRKVVRSDDRSKYKRVAPGDLVYNMMRAWQGAFGSVVVEGMVSPAYVVARPKTTLPTEWIEYLLRTEFAVNEIKRFSRGITDFRLRLYWDEFKNLRICSPPAEERASILRFLDRETAKIDALIAEQQRLIELLQEKRQAVISHAVTKGLNPDAPMKDSGVEWLGEVPEHWEVSNIGLSTERITYGFTNPMPTEDIGPYMLTANDIDNGSVRFETCRRTSESSFFSELTDKSRPVNGDVLLTKDGTLGRVALYAQQDEPACINQSVALLRANSRVCSGEFLATALSSASYQEKMLFDAGGTTIKHIYISRLSKMKLVLPSMHEQDEILASIRNKTRPYELLVADSQRSLLLLQERRSALISAAVTGQIDVRGLVSEADAA